MKRRIYRRSQKKQIDLILGDCIILIISIFISYAIRVYLNKKNPTLIMIWMKIDMRQSFIIVCHVFVLYLLDQYNINAIVSTLRSLMMVVMSVMLGGLIISGVLFFFPKYVFGRQVLLIHVVVVSIFMVVWRFVFIKYLLNLGKSRRLAIVGEGQSVSSFIKEYYQIENSGYDLSSICIINSRQSMMFPLAKLFTQHNTVRDLVRADDFDVLAFDSASGAFTETDIRLIIQMRYIGKAVYDLPTLYKNLTGKVPLTYIDGRWLLNEDSVQGETNVPYVRVKRIFDVVMSLILLVVTLPFYPLIALSIKLDSNGSVFFIQERLGLEKKPFKCIKFRTMVEHDEDERESNWASEMDPRITRVGRVLRKSRMDELPQFWNILKGEMSFVGPRPIREHVAKQLAKKIPFYDLRFGVKPGLTGWAQVNYDYAGSVEGQLEKFKYELFYIQNMSFFLDLLTVLKTIHKVFRAEGT